MNYQCIFCQIRAFERLIEDINIENKLKDSITKQFISYLNTIDYSMVAPEVVRNIHILIRKTLNNPDPYKVRKKEHNEFLLNIYPSLKKKILDSNNPFNTALRMSIAGNIIDYSISSEFNILSTIENVLKSKFVIDHSNELKNEIEKAKTILYLGDNAGEIVLDKLFLEMMIDKNIYYAVRGAPVINDVTVEDAEFVKINEVARIITGAPRTA